MAEEGTVVAVRPGEADIELGRSEACATCNACAPTGGGMLMERVPVHVELHPGDRVSVTITPQATARARVLLFVVPVVALVLGYLAGFLLSDLIGTPQDATGAVVGLILLAASMLAVALYDRRSGGRRSDDVSVRAIIARVKPARGEPAPASSEEPSRRGGQDA